ncbi:MAG: RNA polymerase-associated protein RapA [Syntrophus sp. SKADARSKE-3]|nr:RNA polymerase-associated protein RapA [Syntrophus sp. SKADARSKE-3]
MSSSNIQTKILRHATSAEEYKLYRAGLEWDLTDPIIIETREDLKSESLWSDKLEPYHHQVTNLITFCRRLPVTLLADDVGLGKTISAGLIMSELISRSRLSKILIVCPKLLGPQWQEELITKFAIPSQIAIGRDLIKADPDEPGAIITTYHSARQYLDSIPRDRFQMLVLDEAHKLRNLYGTEKPPKVAERFRNALENRRFRFVLMLTATPIQNRLWDLYSLVDLLTVARGHQNPFGSEGVFARKFIADSREKARQLKTGAREEFRSIVYGYMSRIRRNDAKLYFPERVVQMHKVNPTMAELELIRAIAKPIQKLNRLAQISILQALTSSPEALMAQLNNMARKGSVPMELAATVNTIVTGMPNSAKLNGLDTLINRLKKENPLSWRLVVFTGRLETQTTIQIFLQKNGLKVGIINGMSGKRNQETIALFRKDPPNYNVIVSTEAGSEGVNLQVANVLVNYDLPWNPMIVEQRIGRIQRLASIHASVGIFNIMLRGTFEEYIVGRLMEKLQMAASAIGDIEALLEASGINNGNDNEDASFEEKIRQLVIAALEGKDIEAAVQKEEQSILAAKDTLRNEKEHINAMLGGMDGVAYVGPRAPSLPGILRTMDLHDFVIRALKSFGARITPRGSNSYLVEENGGREFIRFEEDANAFDRSTYYAPGTPAFTELVDRIIASGIYSVEDLDTNPAIEAEEVTRRWISTFGGTLTETEIEDVQRCFEGTALIRVRATVAHDSYERLVEISCLPNDHYSLLGKSGLSPLPHTLEDPDTFGINSGIIAAAAKSDVAIAEFSRFYLERRAQEMQAAGDDERKRKKLEDDFTPRIDMTLVALEGKVYRRLKVKTRYKFEADFKYQSNLMITPHKSELDHEPEFGRCSVSGKTVPQTCLRQCEITKTMTMQHLLIQSEISSRFALPEHSILCSLSRKRILKDEAETSSVSGRLVTSSLLKTSAMSGKRAEPDYFDRCEFTQSEVINTELVTSEVSGKRYRIDEQERSVISGKTGHKSEFIICYETQQPILIKEAEQCEVTGRYVKPGILEECAITSKKVLPSELERCSVTGKRVLKKMLVTSSLSEARILESVASKSVAGKFCAPVEAKLCFWSGRKYHPDDLRICNLTSLPIHVEFINTSKGGCLQPLFELLNDIRRTSDNAQLWDEVANKAAATLEKGRYRVESAILSPDKEHLAICAEVRTLLGFRVRRAGFIYSITDHCVIGRMVHRKLTSNGWVDLGKTRA